jgi:hypothetical protein
MEIAISDQNPSQSNQLNPLIIVNRTPKSKTAKYSYKDVKYDPDKWVDPKKFLPGEYDLCWLKTPRKTLVGWHTGYMWDGSKIQEDDTVLYWKRMDG